MNIHQHVVQGWGHVLPSETSSPGETLALGRALAGELAPGCVVALYGDLGAGKTHLVKGICAGLGVDADRVTSPTFTIVQHYEGTAFPIYHLDAYRVERLEEWYELGVEEYLYGDGLCLIEWPERLAPLLPDDTVHLRLTRKDEERRRIEMIETPEHV